MKINCDFRDLLRSFNGTGRSYLIVGGYAVMAHTEPRYTKDLDVWIEATESNAEALFAGLDKFGAPTADIVPRDSTEPDVVFQIGVEPVGIDIMTLVPGLAFESAWKNRVIVDFGGESAPVLCREDVLKSKIAAGGDETTWTPRSWPTGSRRFQKAGARSETAGSIESTRRPWLPASTGRLDSGDDAHVERRDVGCDEILDVRTGSATMELEALWLRLHCLF